MSKKTHRRKRSSLLLIAVSSMHTHPTPSWCRKEVTVYSSFITVTLSKREATHNGATKCVQPMDNSPRAVATDIDHHAHRSLLQGQNGLQKHVGDERRQHRPSESISHWHSIGKDAVDMLLKCGIPSEQEEYNSAPTVISTATWR